MVTIGFYGTDEVKQLMDRAVRFVDDLSPYFESIASDFFNGNEPYMFRGRPGKYTDLSDKYKKRKLKKYRFIYPVLVASGRLRDSMGRDPHPDQVLNVTKRTLEMGTRVPYGQFHRDGTKHMPARNFLVRDVDRRILRWTRILSQALVNVSENRPPLARIT